MGSWFVTVAGLGGVVFFSIPLICTLTVRHQVHDGYLFLSAQPAPDPRTSSHSLTADDEVG